MAQDPQREEFPSRDITDPRMLRALAHPLRMKLLNALVFYGPATATQLAERVDDTPANCSWHLRQLAKFGFIEEAPRDVDSHGRDRPWRWVPQGNSWNDADADADLAQAGAEVMNSLLGYEIGERNAWNAAARNEPEAWRRAAFTNQGMAWLTAEELTDISQEVYRLFMRHPGRLTDPAQRPEGSRPIRLVAWGVPGR